MSWCYISVNLPRVEAMTYYVTKSTICDGACRVLCRRINFDPNHGLVADQPSSRGVGGPNPIPKFLIEFQLRRAPSVRIPYWMRG
ncbi:uncharacterized protein PGTG_17497 [Puccinia graminis f. sp. tritici CRL 75-36-700-3]|uniref:Uncharacterized protein n=1 Tax=Puccinia graminis f. sp. tritici (strain CRL 75-36-700-3 / race SCCL) TaxID=418459 RepID=E3L516_PUCGT|nr:uncharacterized protein PGTG_17497 [Puccinia graminis f. sp. tritici CRL 75-36-700-3]EFP91641.1 hypothetical protein PGTG_17497 [Puccinia graminis f. sp. tritici CRL 75-36-700-3]